MNDQERCETCKYWQAYGAVTSDDQAGTCARFPPVLVPPMALALAGEKADYMSMFRAINEDSGAWSQPITTALGYCGEWKQADTAPRTKTLIDDADLAVRTRSLLKSAGFEFLEDLSSLPFAELLKVNGVTTKAAREIEAEIKRLTQR